MNGGKVYLVGAGPGDPSLMTLKGLQALKEADVVLYDRLVHPLILEEAPKAERIYCGKLPHRHHLRQEAIQELMVEKAKQGLIVVRLKGGDPGVFGRVGEEAQALVDDEVPYEIVPGITSGISAPLYAGVPVTHRDMAASFAVVTGHTKGKDGSPGPDWESLATGVDTIAFYMGVKHLPLIAEKLIEHGKPVTTPVLMVEWGTTGKQRTVLGTLDTIVEISEKEGIQHPAITIVGDVAQLHSSLSWVEKRRLHGQQILLAQTTPGKSQWAEKLKKEGAEVFTFPRFEDTKNHISFPQTLSSYDRIVFHSAESVDYFFQQLKREKIDIRHLPFYLEGMTRRTKKKLESYGLFLENDDQTNQREPFTLHVGEEEELFTCDLEYDEKWVSHRRNTLADARKTFTRLYQDKWMTTVVFPSAKSVDLVTKEVNRCGLEAPKWANGLKIICLGEKTAKRAHYFGYQHIETLSSPQIEELICSFSSCNSEIEVNR